MSKSEQNALYCASPQLSSIMIVRIQAAPRRTMCGMFERVSTLFTTIGLGAAGVGDEQTLNVWRIICFSRTGSPPSITFRSAFSSPNSSLSGPSTSSIGVGPNKFRFNISPIARLTAITSFCELALIPNKAFLEPTTCEAIAIPSKS